MGFISGLLKIMIEHKAGPVEVLESLSSGRNDIADSIDYEKKEDYSSSNYNSESKPMKTCTSCGGTGEDSERYEPMFDIYAPCSTCHGEGVI